MGWAEGILVGFDTETTGVEAETARIVSAAIVVNDPADIISRSRNWLINPGVEIPLEATAVHGISTEYASQHGREPGQAIAEIVAELDSLRAYPLVMVNAPFDLTILDREIRRHGVGAGLGELPDVIDTLTCDRKLDPYRRGRRTLTAAMAAYGLAIRGAHTAEGDVTGAIRLARTMAARFPLFAACDPARLQELQRSAHAEFAEHFQQYRRSDGIEPDFVACRDWPYRKYEESEAA